MLRNHYRIDLGTSGLVIKAETRSEILADKVVALALRPNRIKNRDLWDILWLTRQNIRPDYELIAKKCQDRAIGAAACRDLLNQRIALLAPKYDEYLLEMRRFLPKEAFSMVTGQNGYWDYLLSTLREIISAFCNLSGFQHDQHDFQAYSVLST